MYSADIYSRNVGFSECCWYDYCVASLWILSLMFWPRAGSGVKRIDPLRFLAGCRKRQLNQAVLSLSIKYSAVCRNRATVCVAPVSYVCVLSLGCFLAVWLSCQLLETGLLWWRLFVVRRLSPHSLGRRVFYDFFSVQSNQFNSNLAAREPDSKWYAVEITVYCFIVFCLIPRPYTNIRTPMVICAESDVKHWSINQPAICRLLSFPQ